MSNIDLTFLGNCPICSSQYHQDKTSVVERADEAITLHIDCSKCGSSILVAVHEGLKGLVTTIGMPTDLNKSDLKRLKSAAQITTDDVLALHAFLERKKTK